jgi:hypothetical protein
MKIWGGGGDIPQTFLTSALDGSGHLHAPAALTPGKEPSAPIGYEAVWPL